MTKNYFTDEQVKALAKKSGIDISYLGYFHELKRLMNLAVEAAIGEAVVETPISDDLNDRCDRWKSIYDTLEKDLPNGTTLYSVKELEN